MRKSFVPVEINHERRQDVRKKNQCEIFKIFRISRIGRKYLEKKTNNSEGDDEQDEIRLRIKQLTGFGHSSQVSADIERIRGKKKKCRKVQNPSGIVAFNIAG